MGKRFTFEPAARPEIPWDFSVPAARPRKVTPLLEAAAQGRRTGPAARAVSSGSPAGTVQRRGEGERGVLPPRFDTLPAELQLMVWAEAMQKPSLHFLAVQVPEGERAIRSALLGDRAPPEMVLAEPDVDGDGAPALDHPHVGDFPRGLRSAYLAWDDIGRRHGPRACDGMVEALVEPLPVAQRQVVVDAATDVLYLQFQHDAGGDEPRYQPRPPFWMLTLAHRRALRGVRHVAVEMEQPGECVFWPTEQPGLCGFCLGREERHDSRVTMDYWLLSDFLHCFPDLETVYAVFHNVRQGPVDRARDLRYTVSGEAQVWGIEDQPGRWERSPGQVFFCDGGTLRELQGSHVVLPLAPVIETMQAYYMYHHRTVVGSLAAESPRRLEDRMRVQFKMAVLEREDSEE